MPETTPSVTMNAFCRFPSSWRADGKLGNLTDKQIEEYQRQGKYGPEMQVQALARFTSKKTKDGFKKRFLKALLRYE